MNQQMSNPQKLPKIIQTLFYVDKTRKYLFDVNQDILIKKLKSMIVSASGLNKVGLRLFHEGKEYTEYDDSTLVELFPDLDLIEFYIQYSYNQVEDLEEIINLKLKQCCHEHEGKYPYFYCFTCGKSICSNCLFSGKHKGHEIKEKYDYLQESKNLVEVLFKDLKDILKNTKEGSNESVEDLKSKVSIKFFPKLVDMVKQIEQKMMNLIIFFLEKEKGNYNIIENNVKLLKSHCQEGLDKLKKEIVIEDMMVDENVFLTFDSKFKEIGNEKEKFKNDIEKYKKFSDNLFLIQSIIEKTYKEIYDFLNKYLIVTEFDDIKNKLNSQGISVIDKKIILDKLLSNIKRKGINELKSPNEENNKEYYLRKRNLFPPQTKELIKDENADNKKKDNLYGNMYKKDDEIKEEKNENMDVDNPDEHNNDKEGKENYIEINPDDKDKNMNNKKKLIIKSGYLSKNINNNNINTDDNNRINYHHDMAKNDIDTSQKVGNRDVEYIPEDNEIYDNNDRNYRYNNSRIEPHIMNLRSGNQKISFGQPNINYRYNDNVRYSNKNLNNEMKNSMDKNYNQNTNNNNYENNNESNSSNSNINIQRSKKKEESEEEDVIYEGRIYNIVCNIVPPTNQLVLYDVDKDLIIRKEINFSPLLGLNHFLSECAWVNNNNKLYILGGVDDFNKSTKIFLEFDPVKDKIKRLPDSNFSHSRQSLFAYNDQIFVVGGDRLECERYDINKNEWSILPNLSFKQIYPVLYVHNDILYSFFGIDENIKKTDNVQKLNLKNNKGKWQKVIYKRNKCNLCVFGCGIAKINDNSVLFLGGMDDNGIRDEAIQFDFNNLIAKKTEFQLEEKAYFKDSVLLRLSPNDFGNFSIEESNPFLKIKFQVNVKKMTN